MERYLIATVYVDKTDFSFDKPFDYLLNIKYENDNLVGCRVIVPFGRGDKDRQGIIISTNLVEEKPKKLKQVTMILDKNPLLNEEQLKICNFMSQNTFATFYNCVKTILPRGSNVAYQKGYALINKVDELDLNLLTYEEQQFIQFLSIQKKKSTKEFKDISKNVVTEDVVDKFFSESVFGEKEVIINTLLDIGYIEMVGIAKPQVWDKTTTSAVLSDAYIGGKITPKLTKKQKEVVEFLENVGFATTKEITYFCGVTDIVIKNLEKNAVIRVFDIEVFRTPNSEIKKHLSLSDIVLSEKQEQVYHGICKMVEDEKANVALLHGITGSGKTQVYIKLIEKTIKSGKQALMLVPEIALTPQMVESFKSLFGEKVAVMHSSLSVGERLDEYKRVMQGKADIVVGTRSAIFMPFKNIGIIIMDEEGEYSYKSDSSPRYHAREIAKFRCVQHKATLLLGSATPSIESYYKAKTGVYTLFSLTQRYSNASLPDVFIVDMKDEEKNANVSSISRILQNEIQNNLQKQEQTILLINRRGYNTVVTCVDCGHVVKCPNCDVALTYHKANGNMMCHYCGHSESLKRECPECHSFGMKQTGLGTQKIEDDLSTLFPSANVLRIDTDTTMSKYALPKQLEKFKKGEYDILVGTQMIAKGLNFPNVTLVGVLNIDQGLYVTDYRCVERVFSLITQVVGRSGRASKKGRAYIQTHEVENPVINFGAKQDYESFYNDEIVSREMLKYPPFYDICVVTFSGVDEVKVSRLSAIFMKNLEEIARKYQGKIALKALGPVEASIYRVNGRYRKKVIIKCKFHKYMKMYLKEVMQTTNKDKNCVGVLIYTDVNGDINA